MSYILEALKKAQAERQLGSAPTLHAVAVGAAPRDAAGTQRRPAWLMPAAVVLVLVLVLMLALTVLAWRMQAPTAKPAASPVAVAASALLAAQPVAPSVTPASEPAQVAALVPAPRPVATRAPAPIAASVTAPVAASVAASVAAHVAAHVARAPPVAAASVAAAAAPEEEKLQSLRELPEAIQRALPPLTFGGYMYSKNPADRLLLIDKTLRHEGEEVAPGLVLEKLLPKAAVMNYKGYRYRVPY